MSLGACTVHVTKAKKDGLTEAEARSRKVLPPALCWSFILTSNGLILAPVCYECAFTPPTAEEIAAQQEREKEVQLADLRQRWEEMNPGVPPPDVDPGLVRPVSMLEDADGNRLTS
jgi:hypothetical protein